MVVSLGLVAEALLDGRDECDGGVKLHRQGQKNDEDETDENDIL